MTSKRQRESPKLVAITDEGNRRFGHEQHRKPLCKGFR